MPKSSKRQKRSQYLVFVSHSSLDAWIAKVMVEKIEALGAECWLDEKDLAGGDVIVEDIIRGYRRLPRSYCADFAKQCEISMGTF